MNQGNENPFGSIEDAHDFMTLMAQTVFETKLEIESDVQRESSSNYPRRAEALKLTLYTLSRLEFHMQRSQRILNDLRTLRRLLFEERTVGAQRIEAQPPKAAAAEMLVAAIPPSPSSQALRSADLWQHNRSVVATGVGL
jgi:hypothetical protein